MLRRLVISGGGTGGHIFPAIAIAEVLRSLQPDIDILFVGAEGKMEMEKVPAAGYRIVGLPITGIQRRLSAENLKLPFRLFKSLKMAGQILRDFKPDAVIGVGGYASGPLLWQATRMGIPSLIQEQNSFPGLTNRWLAGRVQRICVAYEGMDTFFPEKKILLAGNPVRQDLLGTEAKKEAALAYFELEQNKKTLFVFGGSLGARTLNEAVAAGLSNFSQDPGLQVLWQTGKGQFEKFEQQVNPEWRNIRIRPFIDRMDLAYAAADLVVCRAGALTLAELAVVAKPAVLVPSPNVTADHQTHNARAFASKGAGVMLPDAEVLEKLPGLVTVLIHDEKKLETIRQNMTALAKPDAALRIAKAILDMVGKNAGNDES